MHGWLQENHKPFDQIARALFIVSLLAMVTGFFQKDKLPVPSEIVKQLYTQPIQGPTTKTKFVSEFGGKEYNIIPRYRYEISGLVVSQKNLEGDWFTMYYDRDPLNTKDLCVIWGSTLLQENYMSMKYWSGSWVCYFQSPSPDVNINPNELSNNHILPADDTVMRALRKAEIGDQIFFSGYLVDYEISKDKRYRTTSTNRQDTGNGACEVVYVDNFTILKKANTLWHLMYNLSWWVLGISLILKAYSFFFIDKPLFEYQ